MTDLRKHPVDILQELAPNADPGLLDRARELCDTPVCVLCGDTGMHLQLGFNCLGQVRVRSVPCLCGAPYANRRAAQA